MSPYIWKRYYCYGTITERDRKLQTATKQQLVKAMKHIHNHINPAQFKANEISLNDI